MVSGPEPYSSVSVYGGAGPVKDVDGRLVVWTIVVALAISASGLKRPSHGRNTNAQSDHV